MRLVDGDALSKETGKLWSEMPDGEELSKELMKAINHAPTVDAAPVKHGRWVMMGGMKPPEWHHHHQCSVCESYAPMKPPYGGREEFPPFCPACGARMGGVENEHGE